MDTYLNDIEHRGFSIDDLIDHLDSTNVFDNADTQTIGEKRLLVFAVLGWQSMIYQPAFNTRPSDQLAVKRDDDVDSGLVFESYTADAELCDRPLYVLLKGFGNLLPARASNMRPAAATECSKVAASWTPLYPTELNAYLLHTLLNVEFRWVDTLALHLDYDKSSRTLSLFAYPSVCAEARRTGRGAIFAFSSTEGKSALDPRADEKDIEGFLGEVILSFRLLFGQSRKSRKLFRHLFNTAKTPIPQPDNFLVRLCSEVSVCCAAKDAPAWTAPDQPVYYAARHFPVLYERVELLAKELQAAKPKSMVHLLRDRRDTLQFWTFWFVAIFGTIGIILSMVQVALQAVQLAQEASRM